ncbi:MAG: hypothetical protein IKR09_08350 [Alphaproteobacteria bacterium]|nr:hypothetical protein [Alphaproteobacteria bacterium]
MAEQSSKALEETFADIEPTKNILAGQEGLIRRPVFEGEFGKEQKFKGYEIAPVRVKSVYAKEDQLWVKFERLDGKDGFNTRIDNAYQQFRNTKEMTQEEIDKAEWMKARNKLDSPAFVQKMIHEGKDINALMNVAGYTRERFEKMVEKSQGKSLEVPSKEELPSLSRADVPKPTRSKSKGQEKMQEKTGEIVM